jgi:Protein of unknown function (DUF2782)
MPKMKKLLFVLLLAVTSQLQAAQPDNLELLEEVPPPPRVEDGQALEGAGVKSDNGEAEPQVTIRKKGKDTVEEYRINGELYMMKVTPSGGGVPYYLHKEDQDGGWVNIGPNPPLSIPKWILFRF